MMAYSISMIASSQKVLNLTSTALWYTATPSKENILNYLKRFSIIFTTNYDLILDDLVYSKVKHLHGGFNFKSEYERIHYRDPLFKTGVSDYCIITRRGLRIKGKSYR